MSNSEILEEWNRDSREAAIQESPARNCRVGKSEDRVPKGRHPGKRRMLAHERRARTIYSSARLNRNEFVITDTELKLIAAAAKIGLNKIPKKG